MFDHQIPETEHETIVRPRQRPVPARPIVTEDHRGITVPVAIALILSTVAIAMAIAVFVSERRHMEDPLAAPQTSPTPQPVQTVTVIPPPQAQTMPIPTAPVATPATRPPETLRVLTDDRSLEEQVRQKLAETPELAGATITARVSAGWVTLKGEVQHPSMKALAEQLVKQIKGVTGIVNEITIAGQ
jgi:hypothetical protein